jgi:hypothetical protein
LKPGRAAAALLALAAGCAPLPPPVAAPPPAAPKRALGDALLGLVPAPAHAVLSVDVARLRGSPWAKPVLAWAAEREKAGEGGRAGRGFDEMADVETWLFARVGSAAAGVGTLELARGRFEAPRVLEAFAARRPDARATSFGGLRGAADAEQALALLDARTLAFGPPAVVRTAAAGGRTGAAAVAQHPWLASIRGALDDEAGQGGRQPVVELAFVVQPDARQELAEVLGTATELQLERLGGRLFLERDARAVLVGLAPDAREAQALAEQLRENFWALSDRRSVRALGLGPVVRRATATARGARVVLELTITEDERVVVADKLAVVAALLARPPEQPPAAPGPSAPTE